MTRIITLIVAILLPTVSLAVHGMAPGPGAKSYSSGESNAVLVGNTTDLSSGSNVTEGGDGAFHYSSATLDYTATASGTLRYCYLRTGSGGTATYFKTCVYSFSSGTTYNLLECSSEQAVSANSLVRTTHSATKTITQGNKYIVGYIANGYLYVRTGSSTWSMMRNTSGTYSSPPSSVNTANDTNSAGGEIQIYCTNYAQ